MLEWTGERFLPWIEDAAGAYEHLHRYAYATRFVAGKRVLDLGSGEGYGASILARTASSVIGFDVDLETVSHAQRKYSRPNLDFVAASAVQLPSVDPVDVVVCFETLEHIDDQEGLVREAKRILTAEGMLIISTPDKKNVFGRVALRQSVPHPRTVLRGVSGAASGKLQSSSVSRAARVLRFEYMADGTVGTE